MHAGTDGRIDTAALTDAARTFARTDRLAAALDYDSDHFDRVLSDAAASLRAALGTKHDRFMRAVFDAASAVGIPGPAAGRGRLDARLFAMQVHARGERRRHVTSPEGFRRLEDTFARLGMAAPGSSFAFLPVPLSERAMSTMTPGRVRRLARLLAARAVPGLPDPGRDGLEDLFDGSEKVRGGCAAIVGVRVAEVGDDPGVHGDWFARLRANQASDPRDQAAWGKALGIMPDDDRPEVELPRTCHDMAMHGTMGRVMSDLWDDASITGDRPANAGGVLHHVIAGPEAYFALALPGGRVLGPSTVPGAFRDVILDMLRTVLRVGGRHVRHADGDAFSAALRACAAGNGQDHPDPRDLAATGNVISFARAAKARTSEATDDHDV